MRNSEERPFAQFFQKTTAPAKRGTFLSRVLGIFSEELVRIWASDERSPYRDLGRPRVFCPESGKGYSLDFTFEDRATSKLFIVEMKCEIEYQNYRYMTLRQPDQVFHHKKPAFDLFRSVARNPEQSRVEIRRAPTKVDGAILVWGDVTNEGKRSTIEHFGFHDVLGLDAILEDLWEWQPTELEELVNSLGDWSFELFNFLGGGMKSPIQIFKNDDAGFIDWRDSHPDGYICNVPFPQLGKQGRYYLKHVCVHTATCSSVAANKNGEQPWTTNNYFKICANDVSLIQDWFARNADVPDAWEIKRCAKCSP